MKLCTKPLPGYLYVPEDFISRCKYGDNSVPKRIEDIPPQTRYYTRKVVLWRECSGELYRFKLSPEKLGYVSWCESIRGVIVDRSNNYTPVEVEPVSDLEFLFLYQ
jgi:hypothetical protein